MKMELTEELGQKGKDAVLQFKRFVPYPFDHRINWSVCFIHSMLLVVRQLLASKWVKSREPGGYGKDSCTQFLHWDQQGFG